MGSGKSDARVGRNKKRINFEFQGRGFRVNAHFEYGNTTRLEICKESSFFRNDFDYFGCFMANV